MRRSSKKVNECLMRHCGARLPNLQQGSIFPAALLKILCSVLTVNTASTPAPVNMRIVGLRVSNIDIDVGVRIRPFKFVLPL